MQRPRTCRLVALPVRRVRRERSPRLSALSAAGRRSSHGTQLLWMRVTAPWLAMSLLHAVPEHCRTPCSTMGVTRPTDDRATPWRLQQQQQQQQQQQPDRDESAPAEYREVLRLLRAADRSGRWPPTSRAREKVLKVADPLTGGSFSLRNMDADAESRRGTRGNLEFPELSSAVFELEQRIAPGRTPSTMVVSAQSSSNPKPHSHLDRCSSVLL
jgi:hypothetical protein